MRSATRQGQLCCTGRHQANLLDWLPAEVLTPCVLCRSILDDYAKSNANQQMAKDSNRPRQQRASLLDGVKEAVQGVLRPESAGAGAPENHGARVRSLLQPLLYAWLHAGLSC